jgi:nucleoid-associated protein YgaU
MRMLVISLTNTYRQTSNGADQLQSHAEEKFMANLTGLAGFVSELRVVRTNLVDQLRYVDAALTVLGKLNGASNHTKPTHTMSASARRKISLAQKARWAKAKGHAPKPKRTISAAGRKRIAAAARARWKKFRAAKRR